MTEFSLSSVTAGRELMHWLARRHRISLTGLVAAAGLRSKTLVTFANLNPATQRTFDTQLGQLLYLINATEHRLYARPAGAKHFQLRRPGAVPLEIRAPGGELLEIPLSSLEEVRTLGHTMIAANNRSLTSLAGSAGLSAAFVTFVNGSTSQQGLSLRVVLDNVRVGGFELFVRPLHNNRREARRAGRVLPATAPDAEDEPAEEPRETSRLDPAVAAEVNQYLPAK